MRRIVLALAACVPLVSGCEGFSQRVDASRQDRCQRADWRQVGQRDGVEGVTMMAERYQHICGDMFQPGPYQEGLRDGLSRRPRPPV